jgi:DNA-binding NtrC family response regulator
VRVIAATNRDLGAAVREGTFRSDLYYRLAVLHVPIPPLREHAEDIEPLCKLFVDRFSRTFHKTIRAVSPRALQALCTYGWPGNVRELKNVVERAVLLAEGETLGPDDFALHDGTRDGAPHLPLQLPAEGLVLDDVERSLVEQALARAGGNRTRAGELLGLTRDQVRYRIEKFGLDAQSAKDRSDD